MPPVLGGWVLAAVHVYRRTAGLHPLHGARGRTRTLDARTTRSLRGARPARVGALRRLGRVRMRCWIWR